MVNVRSTPRRALAALLAAGLLALAGCGAKGPAASPEPGLAFEAPAPVAAQARAAKLALFVEPQAGFQPLTEAIEAAEKSVDVEVYMLSSKDIMNAMIAAARRGVKVRVLLEPNIYVPPPKPTPGNPNPPASAPNLNKEAAKYLAGTGVQVSWADPRFALTHQKSMVVDGKIGFICNSNWTTSSFVDRRDYNVITRDAAQVAEMQKIFNADWNHKAYEPGAGAKQLVISPISSRSKLSDLIARATKSLAIEMEVCNDEAIIKQLVAKQQSGVDVKFLMPDHQADMAKALREKGLDVRQIKKPVMHAKLILRDGVEAYTGSINLTLYSMDKNRELGIIQAEPALIQTLGASFAADWQAASAEAAAPAGPADVELLATSR